jgi:hypothetical protein
MPKAKPVSLFPLKFDEALKRLMDVDPRQLRIPMKPRKKTIKKKPKR